MAKNKPTTPFQILSKLKKRFSEKIGSKVGNPLSTVISNFKGSRADAARDIILNARRFNGAPNLQRDSSGFRVHTPAFKARSASRDLKKRIIKRNLK